MRFVIDEASFDLDELAAEVVADSVFRLGQTLSRLRASTTGLVGLLSGWGGLPCWRGMDVARVLSGEEVIARDDRLLLLSLLDKCVDIEDEALELDLEPDMIVADAPVVTSYGIALAHRRASVRPFGTCGVISLAHLARTGELKVARASERKTGKDVVFVTDFRDTRLVWRMFFGQESVPEVKFFEIAAHAFPDLLFHPDLNFSRFHGGYAVRDQVVEHLSRLNDGWTDVYVAEAGNSDAISTRLQIAVSRESSKTRASDTLMKERDVVFNGTKFRCEWHSKLEPHQNRIHFHPAGEGLDRPLIGIFAEHLPTEG